MKTLYDVQQLLKQFGIYVYLGKRLFDIELMKLELGRLYDNGLVNREQYLQADLILRREHRVEMEKENERK
ncbi:YqgQ family protein [Streptococcus suis]|nr:YqgQ family protein [Streptococcus suis]